MSYYDEIHLQHDFNEVIFGMNSCLWVYLFKLAYIFFIFFPSSWVENLKKNCIIQGQLDFQLVSSCSFWKVESPNIVFPILLVKRLDCHKAGLKLFKTWWNSGFPWALSANKNSGKAAKVLEWNVNYNALHCYKIPSMTEK